MKGFLATLLSFCFFSSAQAALLLEFKSKHENGSLHLLGTKQSFNSFGQGLKIGYMGNYILTGLSFDQNRTYFNEGFSSQTGKIYSGGGIGTFLGFHFWDRLRVETTYLNSALEANSNDEFRYFGQYFSYGLGLRLWKGFMLNYSKFNNQYTQSENDETGLTLGLSNNIKTEGESISLSYILVIK
ncbi:MAG: hypothetical protein CME65_13815 [Halobacteriovoraceae bacterium]|nr:hypothetical protein [Halobacteriovoraceae bacterium]